MAVIAAVREMPAYVESPLLLRLCLCIALLLTTAPARADLASEAELIASSWSAHAAKTKRLAPVFLEYGRVQTIALPPSAFDQTTSSCTTVAFLTERSTDFVIRLDPIATPKRRRATEAQRSVAGVVTLVRCGEEKASLARASVELRVARAALEVVVAEGTAPMPSLTTLLPDRATGPLAPLVDAGPHAVARAALAGDHTGANAKAFAIEARPGRVDLVVVRADWREGLPAGPRGAAALAEALREGLWVTATDGRPAVEADVVARGEHLLVDLRAAAAGAPPPRVAPVLDNAGFALLARPGLTEDPTAPGAAADPAVDLVPLGAEVVVGAAGGLRGGTAPLPPGVEQASQVAVGALAAVAAIVTGLALGWANLRDLALVVGVVLAGAAGAVLAWRPLVGWWRTLGRVQPAGRPRPPRPGRPVAKVQLRPHKRRP